MRTNMFLASVAVLGLMAGGMQQVFADIDPYFDFYKEPGLYPTRSYLNQHFNEHIDPHTGRLQHHYVDVFIPGNGGLDLKIQRSYSSVDDAGPVGQLPYEVSPFGIGWTMHFGRVLRRTTVGICTTFQDNGSQMPVLELPDGSRQILFRDDTHFPNESKFISTSRWRAQCIPAGGLSVFAPDGTRYDMTQGATIGTAPADKQAWYTTLITDRNGNTITIGYTTVSGYTVPQTVTTSDQRTVTFTYTGNPVRLSTVVAGTSPETRTWTYTYQAAGGGVVLTQVALPGGGGNWTYSYKTTGSPAMASVTYPQGGSISYTYQQVGFAPGPSNTAIMTKTTSDNGTWNFAFTPSSGSNHDSTTITGPNSTRTTYAHVGYNEVSAGSYWQVGLLLQKTIGTTQAVEQTENYTWGSLQISDQDYSRPGGNTNIKDLVTKAPHLTQKQIVRNGNTYTTTYSSFDQFGNPQSVLESSSGFSRTTTLTYQANTSLWIIRQVKDETIAESGFPNFAITRTIDSNGNVTQENRFGVSTNYTYNAGNLASRTNARGKTTTFSSYKRGIPQTEGYPEDQITVTRVVSNAGNVESETDGKNDTTGYGYDALNRITSLNYPVLNDVSVAYTTGSTRMTITRGSLIQTVDYDGFGRLACVTKTDSLSPTQNSRVTLTHNALSQRTFVSNPVVPSGSNCPTLTVGTSMTYDTLDRLKTVAHPDSTGRSYNYGSTTVAVTNERGIIHTYSYRAYGNPDKRELMGIAVPAPDAAASVTIARNPIGRITSVIQNSKTRAYGYNTAGNFLTSIDDPETGITTFGRDEVGNMVSRTVTGTPTTSYAYDNLDRLSQITYPGGLPTVVKTYYRDGRLKTVDFGTSAFRYFEYDQNKNLTLDRLIIDGRTYSVSHAYTGNDARSTTTFPSGTVLAYTPNGFGRPTTASPFTNSANSVDFHPSGELKSIAFANGITTSITLTNRLWPLRMTSSRPSLTAADLQYGYDGTGNVTRFEDFVDPANTMPRLQYDSIDRLLCADTGASNAVLCPTTSGSPIEIRRLTYDGDGNIATRQIGATTRNYNYHANNNRLTSISNSPYTSFTYDSYGNVTSNTASNFNYNDALQMTCAKCNQAGQTAFGYDGLNMRVRAERVVGGVNVVTYFMYGLDGQLLLEETPITSSWGYERKEYAYLHGRLIGVKATTQIGTTTTPSTPSYVSAVAGAPVTMTVSIAGSSPTGTVTFKEGSTTLGTATVSNGVASFTLSTLSVGNHFITANYSGDANNAPSSTTFQVYIYDLSWLPAILQLLLD